MCAIFGAITWCKTEEEVAKANKILLTIYNESHERGRDGRGYIINSSTSGLVASKHEILHLDQSELPAPQVTRDSPVFTLIGNTRAEPTTEYVKDKHPNDQQPYTTANWAIVHNGTIANDKWLREGARQRLSAQNICPTQIDSAAIVETLQAIGTEQDEAFSTFFDAVDKIKGSYAILATHNSDPEVLVAVNYRPVWYLETSYGTFFASTRESFGEEFTPRMVEPYSAMRFGMYGSHKQTHKRTLRFAKGSAPAKGLVVCSGGLDSVVSAVYAQKRLKLDIELIHFLYGSRAEGPEVKAVQEVAKAMGVPLKLFNLPVYDKSDSPLLNPDAKVAGGEEGAEFAHEWVPARNLLLLAVATAYAEAKGHRYLVLGNNLEEAGAYPDNEPEFIAKYNDLLPFAVGDGKELQVIMPVGNMMKHEIVKLGKELDAPMHLTWSCYRAGHMHCGTCGPCFMRRTAFKINNFPEVIPYEK